MVGSICDGHPDLEANKQTHKVLLIPPGHLALHDARVLAVRRNREDGGPWIG